MARGAFGQSTKAVVRLGDYRSIDGLQIAHRVEVANEVTGRTIVEYDEVVTTSRLEGVTWDLDRDLDRELDRTRTP